ncbi:carbonyl reductase [NADPH] 1-like isoform X2 [Haliotis rubra]|uniref:carbonyl reductase [NADPH] 1-like isoform X2 n=1 Tax=Haliotis rubra TaxID=36100 RepID=UPI001EE51E1E|nr:carbonyl reductase [NADPH] 1-like isoform X2 [Haliotis rubra]
MAEAVGTRVAVVTGGNKGLGFEVVKSLCRLFKGDVLLTARNESLGRAAVASLEQTGLKPKFFQLDITDQTSIASLATHLSNKYGGLDVLVNNAGIMFGRSSTSPFEEQVKTTMKVNFWANLNVCKTFFPLLRSDARVVNVSSMLGSTALNKCAKDLKGRFTSPHITLDELESLMETFENDVSSGTYSQTWPETAYGVSKIGVTTMSLIQQRLLDREGKTDVVVNACCPGWCRTDMGGQTATNSAEEERTYQLCFISLPGLKGHQATFRNGLMFSAWEDVTVS